ncbi:MAG: QueT transporter family protein [Solirubrobacterales bacterium]
MSTRSLTRAGVIGALYVLLSIPAFLPFLTISGFQIRPAEALTVLPILLPEAIPGLFVGCILANLLAGLGPVDVVCGSLVTLLAAYLTYRFRESWLAYSWPIVLNAFLVSLYLQVFFKVPYWPLVGSILVTEGAVVLLLGIPLIYYLKRNQSQK